MKRKYSYMCEFCENIFESKEEALACEKDCKELEDTYNECGWQEREEFYASATSIEHLAKLIEEEYPCFKVSFSGLSIRKDYYHIFPLPSGEWDKETVIQGFCSFKKIRNYDGDYPDVPGLEIIKSIRAISNTYEIYISLNKFPLIKEKVEKYFELEEKERKYEVEYEKYLDECNCQRTEIIENDKLVKSLTAELESITQRLFLRKNKVAAKFDKENPIQKQVSIREKVNDFRNELLKDVNF